MSLVFENFEEFRQNLMAWRKREGFTLDIALSTEIELEILLAELPISPFEDWIDGIGPGKYWGGCKDGKPFVIEFWDTRKPAINFYWRVTPWPDEPFAWSFLNHIRNFPVQLIRPGFCLRNSWEPHLESIFLEGHTPTASPPFPNGWEFYRSGSREETDGLITFLSDWGWTPNWRIGPPN